MPYQKINRLVILLMLCGFLLQAQETVQKPVLLTGGTLHIGNEQVIKNAALGFENGKITLVADAHSTSIDKSKYDVIDVTGKHIYPGLIAPNTLLGLVEVEALRQTRDFDEVGKYNPNVRSVISYNTDSKIIPTIRSNGVLLAQVKPTGGRISGTSSIMKLAGWNWEDAAYVMEDGVHVNWPSFYTRKGRGEPLEENKKWGDEVNELKAFFYEAKAYHNQEGHERTNLKFEALKSVFEKKANVYIHTHRVKEMISAISFAKELDIKPVIVGGHESYMIANVLKKENVPVILHEVHSLPPRKDDDIDLPFRIPSILQEAGVLYCLSMGGAWQQRNLPFQAGTAVAYGLTKEQALRAITFNAAKILGIEGSTGSLEKGKDATFVVSEGDILDMRTSKVSLAFIQGKKVDLNTKQKDLYRKYMEKYGEEVPETVY